VIGVNCKAQLGMQQPEALLQEVAIILGQRPRTTVVENNAWQLFIDSNRTSETVHDQKHYWSLEVAFESVVTRSSCNLAEEPLAY
jgi:hypothetical protein